MLYQVQLLISLVISHEATKLLLSMQDRYGIKAEHPLLLAC